MVLSGKYKTGEQILRLTNERFAVPEILFHPSDIGIQEMGIPEAIVYSIQNLPEGRFIKTMKHSSNSYYGICWIMMHFLFSFRNFLVKDKNFIV